ncbi:MAG: hypothetical protein HP492_18820 [Nitrospira sp.]|nr:hypothetical protein [Nitrospira sp.]
MGQKKGRLQHTVTTARPKRPLSFFRRVLRALLRPRLAIPSAIEALWQGNLIGAITVVRQERNLGLKEAKGQVEVYIASQPALKKKMDKVLATVQRRFIRWVIGLLMLAAGITLLVLYVL